MQQPFPETTKSLLAVRKPLGDISNDIPNNEDKKRVQMMELEKKLAETLYGKAITEKEVIRLQAIKTLNLLQEKLARTEDTLTKANVKFENQRIIYEKKSSLATEENDDRINMIENEKSTANQEHETVLVSMYFEREQFASRLFDLEETLSNERIG
jgi:hypothetical protein